MINSILGLVFLLCYAYQLYYIVIALIKKRRPHTSEPKLHRFAVLISARNEEKVITELIESINSQDYPSELVTVFTMADNCTDRTAELARQAGAVVYEREDKKNVGKGFALELLFECINRDFPGDAFDAFFVFDADNVLTPNYITEMNKTYSDGYLALTSYRNSKNYGDNWISAGYALWFLREAKYLNNSRMILGTSCAVSGTGFMIDRSLLEDENGRLSWDYFLLTEDIEFTTSSVCRGVKIGYCGDAEFFDEQPVTLKQSFNQRLRWAKGYLQVYANYGKSLIKGLLGKNRKKNGEKLTGMNRFSCFDMTMTIMPAMILSGFLFIADIIGSVVFLCMGEFAASLKLLAMPTINASLLVFIVGLITTVSEWNNIHAKTYQKLLYTLTFPVFMLTYIPIALTSLFKKVEWTPVEHSKSVSLADIKRYGKKDEALGDTKGTKTAKKATDTNK